MNKYALIVLQDEIKTKKFKFKDEFETARQALITKDVEVICLKWHDGVKRWVQQEIW